MGASPSIRINRTLKKSSAPPLSQTTEEDGCHHQGTYTTHSHSSHRRLHQKPCEDNKKSHSGDDRNINNAHNRYSNHDFGSDYISTTSLFFRSRANSEITILRISVGIENKNITTDEASKSVLKYKTPHFRAKAIVEIPKLEEGKRVEIGWIQVCHSMHCVNVYGHEGLTSWEFPEIVLGKFQMVSDSDGKRYPWYGTKHELQSVEGPTDQPTRATVIMHDNFFPQITWHIPVKGYSRQPRLTNIYRKQKFFTYLAIRQLDKDAKTGPIRALHAVEWTMEVDIVVDPSLPLGNRVLSVRPRSQEQVAILDAENRPLLTAGALDPPNANNSQALLWRPFSDSVVQRPCVVVKPLHSTINIDSYLDKTKEFARKLVNNWTISS